VIHYFIIMWSCRVFHQSSRLLTRPISSLAEETYQRALQRLKMAQQMTQSRQDEHNRQLFEAWQSAESSQKAIKGGVAVVKTIAKQSRMKHNSSPRQDEDEFYQQAQDLLEQAGNLGHGKALLRLGHESKSAEQACDYFRRSGLAEGWFHVGALLWDTDQKKEALEALNKAIELGDANALYFMGVHYLDTTATTQDESLRSKHEQGIDYITKAAGQGHSGATYYLALFYLQGSPLLGIPPCSTPEYAKRLDQAVEAGSADALFVRAHDYFHGVDGRVTSHTHALQDYEQAAALGHAEAAVSAGVLHYHNGNHRRAFEFYQLGGELGSLEGWRNVVACYREGHGVPQSHDMADYIAKTLLKNDDDEDRSSSV
jgi:TPR repeat protein